MKKFIALLLVLGLSSVASAGTMSIAGLPPLVNTNDGDVSLSLSIVSNGQLDNDSIYVYTYGVGKLNIAGASNIVVDGEIYDDSLLAWLGDYVDTTGVSLPIVWADIAIPKAVPDEIIGDILTGIGLTIPQGFEGMLEVKVLSENSGLVEGVAAVDCYIPEPMTIALMGLGGLFLRRRK